MSEKNYLADRYQAALDYSVAVLSDHLEDHGDECLRCKNRKFATEALAWLRSLLAAAEARDTAKDEALKKAEHELITLHNLDASDDPERLFRNPFTIDTSVALDAVQLALYGPSRRPDPKPEAMKCASPEICGRLGDCCCQPVPSTASSTIARPSESGLREIFRHKADFHYRQYIEQLRRTECLGQEQKFKEGRFGKDELEAHCRAAEHLGKHKAFSDAAVLSSPRSRPSRRGEGMPTRRRVPC